MDFPWKNEKELNEARKRLEQKDAEQLKREAELDRREADLNHRRELLDADKGSFESERKDHVKKVSDDYEKIAKKGAEINKRKEELVRLEAEKKAGFEEAQAAAFEEIITKRMTELDARQKALNTLSGEIATRLDEVTKKEGSVAKRELDVTEREQNADAGFADKATVLAEEAKRQHDANQNEAKTLKDREDALAAERKKLEEDKEELRKREQSVAKAEILRDAGYSDLRTALDNELNDMRTKCREELEKKRKDLRQKLADQETKLLADLDEEIEETRRKRLEEMNASVEKMRTELVAAAKQEAKRILDDITKERTEWTAERQAEQNRIKKQNADNENKSAQLSAWDARLNGKEKELEKKQNDLDMRMQRVDDEIQIGIAEYKTELDSKNRTLEESNKRLLDELETKSGLLSVYRQMERSFKGKDPAEILLELNTKTDELKKLREDLAIRPTEELRESYKTLEDELNREKGRADGLEQEVIRCKDAASQANELRRANEDLQSDNTALKQMAKRWEDAANSADAELKRLRNAYERPAEVAARYKEIEMPIISADEFKAPVRKSGLDEIDWLNGIYNACDEYGLHFPMRILKAFHTAVKTAEWSPLTVLAGVSGTGKSELPRLYSHFGGMLFMPLSVQPNWDSQESMLGFFNSIDNKFDAQPVLRFLAQSQQPPKETYENRIARWQKMADRALNLDPEKQKDLIRELRESDYPGLSDCMCMVLLDEMNLAHPELYFAEFLSKLELRRGMKGQDVPYLPVKIGAGLPPYELSLGRNVRWIGTMNQDETTKSLSDKVLDRSIIISFPRPTKLKRRQELTALDETNQGTPLHKDNYYRWLARKSDFSDTQVEPFKVFVQKMNEALGVAGRAIGHRVWQSVEYYMANYPDVRAVQNRFKDPENPESEQYKDDPEYKDQLQQAMHIAFEDQLVQKIMPKLRGIDTRGKTKTDCLEKIRDLIANGINDRKFDLLDDFDQACELGYGQFMWQTANYLSREEDAEAAIASLSQEEEDDDADSDADKQQSSKTKRTGKKSKK